MLGFLFIGICNTCIKAFALKEIDTTRKMFITLKIIKLKNKITIKY